jgi:hypothetical protein
MLLTPLKATIYLDFAYIIKLQLRKPIPPPSLDEYIKKFLTLSNPQYTKLSTTL